MYLHRPDFLSFAFGLLFTLVGLAVLLGVAEPDGGALFALLAVTLGVGVAGRLLTGDVHRRAAERLARRAAARVGAYSAPLAATSVVIDDGPVPHLPAIDDPVFGAPISPDELDRAYRETFGDDDPPTSGAGQREA